MADFSKWLIFALEQYKLAKEILKQREYDEMSVGKAKEIFFKLEKHLTLFKQKEAVSQISQLSSLLNYEIALIFIKLGQTVESEEYFQKSWDLIEEYAFESECVMLALGISADFGKMWKERNVKSQFWKYLEWAYRIHCLFKISQEPCLVQFEDLFLNADERKAKLKENSIMDDFLIKNNMIDEYFKGDFIRYRLSRLKQLLSNDELDQFAWALDCFSFAAYFIGTRKFPMARYVLCCTKKMADDFEATFTNIESKSSDQWQWLLNLKMVIASQWVLYIAYLLKLSRQIVWDTKTQGLDLDGLFKAIVISDDDSYELYPLFEEKDIKEYENQIPCALVHNCEEARALFLIGRDQFKLCESYDLYQKDLQSQVKISADFSSLYDSLSKFETDMDRSSKMYKRAIDLLESAFKKINHDTWLCTRKKIIYDLGSLYYDANKVKRQKVMSKGNNASNFDLNKIQRLKNKAIYYLELSTQFCEDENGKIDVEILSEIDLYGILSSYVKLAQLFSQHPHVTLEDKKKAVQHYKFVIDYINKKPHCEKYIQDLATLSDVKIKYFNLITELKM